LPDLPDGPADDTSQTLLEMAVMAALLQPEPGTGTWAEQFTALLHVERDRVCEFLAAQQARLERAGAVLEEQLARLEDSAREPMTGTGGQVVAAGDDYRRRYEMALDDLRGLKAENAALQRQLANARSTVPAPTGEGRAHGGGLDWEAEKRRILAALESDFNENDSDQRVERLKIEDVLRTTEKIIAQRDCEIRELQQRLEDASCGVRMAAGGAAAIEHASEVDAAVREERERLKQLQDELQEKLRQAEIDLSVERAKLARQRAELEERTRSAVTAPPQTPAAATAADDAEPPAHGRWLARLGLTEADRVHRRKR
jgi:hypothetical protein